MDRKTFKNVEMLARVVEFGATHTNLFPKDTFAGQAFAALGAALTVASDQASSQLSGMNDLRTSTKVRAAAREALRVQLQRISETAAAISIDTPEIEDKFRLPDQRRDQAIILAGRAFANEAQSLKKEFIQHHLANDFVAKLNAAVADFEGAILQQSSSKSRRVKVTKALDKAMNTCLTLLQRVDAVVMNVLGEDTALLAEWNTTRHIGPQAKPTTAPEPVQTSLEVR